MQNIEACAYLTARNLGLVGIDFIRLKPNFDLYMESERPSKYFCDRITSLSVTKGAMLQPHCVSGHDD